ncbi:MAG TPA: hypothetical protein DCO79_09330 [Spirochaeta sp.]|nr:hypothetical protein [Spirochaeta sp.]
MEAIELQNKVLRYTVIGLILLVILLGAVMSIYISDTASLRRDMLEYAQESIKLQYEQLKDQKDKSFDEGYGEIEQLEKLIDDYRNNSMDMDELLQGMESEINSIRGRT